MIGKIALAVFFVCVGVALLQLCTILNIDLDVFKLVCVVGAIAGFVSAVLTLV